MTQLGIIHLLSSIYLSFIICLAVSVNEHRQARKIVRETLRRWIKLAGLALLIGVIVSFLD